MKRHLALALGLLLATGLLAGCGKSTNSSAPRGTSNGTAANQAQVNDALAANPNMVNEDVYESATPLDVGTAMGFAAINPLHWWRRIDNVTRTFDTVFSDPDSTGNPTMALVTVNKHLTGTFNILVGDTTATDTTRTIIRKPLDDTWVRHILLRRLRVDSTETGLHPRWRIIGTSGVQVTAKDAVTKILSLHVVAGTVDTTITDPLELHRLRRLLWIAPDTQIMVTVTTNSADDAVFLYQPFGRRRFHSNGDGTFSLQWTTSDFGGLRHFGVDAISHGTLYDDTAPYDSQAWIVPFGVRWSDCELDHGDD